MLKLMNCPIPEPSPEGYFELELPVGAKIVGADLVPQPQKLLATTPFTGDMKDPRRAMMAAQQQMNVAPVLQVVMDPDQRPKKRRFQVAGPGGNVDPTGQLVGTFGVQLQMRVYIFELPTLISS